MADTKLSPTESLVLSSIAATVSKISSAPLENAKLLKQSCRTLSEIEDVPIYLSNPSRSTLLFLYQIIKHEGISSLFAGTSYAVFRYFPTQMLNFMLKDGLKNAFKVQQNASTIKRFLSKILAGSLAGAITLVAVYPLDTIKVIYATDINGTYRSGQKTLSWIRLYSGYGVSIVGILAYRTLYFGLYESFGSLFFTRNTPIVVKYLFGYSATVISGLLSYPIDTIRRRQMITGESAYNAAKQMVDRYGWFSLCDGAMMNVYRGMLGAMTLALFDNVKLWYIDNKKEARIRKRKQEIYKYRSVRNSILFEFSVEREDWKLIVVNVIAMYLDEYMQNEDMFDMQLTDSFAVKKWKSTKTTDYLAVDHNFYRPQKK